MGCEPGLVEQMIVMCLRISKEPKAQVCGGEMSLMCPSMIKRDFVGGGWRGDELLREMVKGSVE